MVFVNTHIKNSRYNVQFAFYVNQIYNDALGW